jgi:hypothetical protein
MTEYDDELKEICWQTYWEGYKLGLGVEATTRLDYNTAQHRFERWWNSNA